MNKIKNYLLTKMFIVYLLCLAFILFTEIDLHGYTHDDAKQNLENKLILEYNNNNFPVLIITGNSTKMKSIVYEVSKELNFTVTTPLDNNVGALVVK